MPDSSSLIFPELFEGSYPLPVPPGSEFPWLPRSGIHAQRGRREPEDRCSPSVVRGLGHKPFRLCLTRRTTRRNLFPRVLSRGGKRLGVSSRPSPCRDSTAQVQFSRRALCKLLPSACSVICRKSAALVKGTAPSAKGSTVCASAWTVSITARIAGKRAMSH